MGAEELQAEWDGAEGADAARERVEDALWARAGAFHNAEPSLNTAEATKSGVCTELSEAMSELGPLEDPYDIADRTLKSWAGTSNDGSGNSLLMQRVAEEEFASPRTPWQAAQEPEFEATVTEEQVRVQLKTMYATTQAMLADIGANDYITAYRGARLSVEDADRLATPGVLRDNALSSASTSVLVATEFRQRVFRHRRYGTEAVTLEIKVRRRDILCAAATGLGCLNEGELVLLGGRGLLARVIERELEESMREDTRREERKRAAIIIQLGADPDDPDGDLNADWILSAQAREAERKALEAAKAAHEAKKRREARHDH